MLDRPIALVTGGSRGIGRGICQALARAGYGVAINYADNEAAALQTKQSLGGTPALVNNARCSSYSSLPTRCPLSHECTRTSASFASSRSDRASPQ